MTENDQSEYQLSCLSYWFPKLEAAGLPVPKTIILKTDLPLIELCDGNMPPGFLDFAREIQDAAWSIGLPCFLRTGQGSGKHGWERTCYLRSAEFPHVALHIRELVEWSETVDMVGLPWNVWAVRELLPTEPLFRCNGYGNMPVVREFRAFVKDGDFKYLNYYWPYEALGVGGPDVPDWPEIYLRDMDASEAEKPAVIELATQAAAVFEGAWSIDLLATKRGWYITDMAPAERSYGYDPDQM